MYCDQNIPRSRNVLMTASEWNQLAEESLNQISSAIYHDHGISFRVGSAEKSADDGKSKESVPANEKTSSDEEPTPNPTTATHQVAASESKHRDSGKQGCNSTPSKSDNKVDTPKETVEISSRSPMTRRLLRELSEGVERNDPESVERDGIRHLIRHTVFHVCDYCTMLAVPKENIDAKLRIKPHFLPSQTHGPREDFPAHIKKFIRSNLDYIFLTFAIWDNGSELPILLRPPRDRMPNAHSIMNNKEFIQLQKFKHDALRFQFWSENRNPVYEGELLLRNVPSHSNGVDNFFSSFGAP